MISARVTMDLSMYDQLKKDSEKLRRLEEALKKSKKFNVGEAKK